VRKAIVILLLVASVAHAEQLPASAAAEAKAQYDKGVVAYNLQKFDDAIAAFTRAYEIDPAPILLFNIAQSHWKKGENERAVFFYRRYLDADPKAENRDKVETRIRELEEASKAKPTPPAPLPAVTLPPPATEHTAPPSAVRPEPPVASLERAVPPEPAPIYRRPWFWGAVGGAVVAGVVAAFLLKPGERAWNCPPCVKTVDVP
jgi:tetratricopeptide (TPR) repeat protein